MTSFPLFGYVALSAEVTFEGKRVAARAEVHDEFLSDPLLREHVIRDLRRKIADTIADQLLVTIREVR